MRLGLKRFSLRLATPLSTSQGTIDQREGWLLRVEDGDVVGIGEATPLPGWTEPDHVCEQALEYAQDVLARSGPADAVDALGGAPAARHGLTLALRDLRARRDGVPLYEHLGGEERVESVPVNAVVGDDPVTETVDAATTAVDVGFRSLKVKVGARDVAEDAERLTAVRDAVGQDVEIRADANGAWTRPEARRALDAFAAAAVSYVEQPLPGHDLRGHAALRGGDVDVAVDETLAATSFDAVIETGAADVLILKPMVLGGVDRVCAVAQEARDASLTSVVTTTVDAAVARVGAVHAAAAIPDVPACGLATGRLLDEDVAGDPAPVELGRIHVPQGPGLGFGEVNA